MLLGSPVTLLLIAPVSDRREPVQAREERGSAYASNWLERDRCWIVNGMGFRRLAEKGGENVEMIRLASITTGLDLAESSSSRGRLKTDRFAAIPTLSRYCERVFLSTVRPKKEDAWKRPSFYPAPWSHDRTCWKRYGLRSKFTSVGRIVGEIIECQERRSFTANS